MSKAARKEAVPRSGTDLFEEEAAGPVFVPCNRESALLVLGSLCVGDVVPYETDIAKLDDHVALLSDGLRSEEEVLVSAGDPRRFPVLLEVPPESVRKEAGVWFVSMGELKRVVFRSQDNADEFRFRPVDEVDTEALPFKVDPALFGLEGPARFLVEPVKPTPGSVLADRLAAAVHCTTSAAESQPELRSAALKFFGRPTAGEAHVDAPVFSDLAISLVEQGREASLTRAVVTAFADAGSAHDIVSSISAADPKDRKLQVWAAMARDVLQNRIELSGDRLSDDGTLLLRAAILALAADTPRAIGKFLHAERPPGASVAVMAAFLGGLRRGVLNLSWSEKGATAPHLSRLTAALLARLVDSAVRRPPESEIHHTLEADPIVRVTVAGIPVAEWPEPGPQSNVISALKEPLEQQGFHVLGAGESPESVIIALGDFRTEAVLNSDGLCVLKAFADPTRKLRKKTEIAESFRSGGALWYPGPFDGDRKFLFCDLPHLPQSTDRALLTSKLAAAFDLLFAPKKPKRSRAKAPKTSQSTTQSWLAEE